MSAKNDDFKECSEKVLKIIGVDFITRKRDDIFDKRHKSILNWAAEFSRYLGHLSSSILYLARKKRPAHKEYDRVFIDAMHLASLIVAFCVFMEKEYPGNFDHYVKEFRYDAK